MDRATRFMGLMLGQAIGDAVGLSVDGLDRESIASLAAPADRLRAGAGADFAVLTGQALLVEPNYATAFARAFAKRLRWWRWSAPRRGLGGGPDDGDACLCATVIGLRFVDDEAARDAFTRAAARELGAGERATTAALAVALACGHLGAGGAGDDALAARLRRVGDGDASWRARVDLIFACLNGGLSVEAFARRAGCGPHVPPAAYDCASLALYAWLRRRDRAGAPIVSAAGSGGATALTAAIAGALAGAEAGADALPADWVARWRDWPRSPPLMRMLGGALSAAREVPTQPITWAWPFALPTNLVARWRPGHVPFGAGGRRRRSE